jgi:hypothetical protein
MGAAAPTRRIKRFDAKGQDFPPLPTLKAESCLKTNMAVTKM